MSETQPLSEETRQPSPYTAPAPGEHGAHPTEKKYIQIAVILAVVTAGEVGLYYLKANRGLTNSFLLVLAATKFTMVAAYFMHLKFEKLSLFLTLFPMLILCIILMLMIFMPDSLRSMNMRVVQ